MAVEKSFISPVTIHVEKYEPTVTQGLKSSDKPPLPRPRKRHIQQIWRTHTKKIIFACSITLIPMLTFTFVLIGLVFSHTVEESPECAHSELCTSSILSNSTSGTSSLNYYVNFPSARLAFLASLSSTISFSLVSVLMMLYAYSVACELLQKSRTRDFVEDLPTPYQTSMLVRVLNAELLSLWELGFVEVIRTVFKMKLSTWREDLKSPRMLRNTLLVFGCCLFSR